MSFFPVPDVMARDIYALDPRVFTDRGIRFILLDIDNTLAPYSENTPTPRMARASSMMSQPLRMGTWNCALTPTTGRHWKT